MRDFLRRLWSGTAGDFDYEIAPPRDDLPPEMFSPRDPEVKLLHVSAGGLWAGGVHADRANNPGPNSSFEISYMPDYYLAETEVTNAQYARFLNDTQPGDFDLRLWILLARDHHTHEIVAEGDSYSVMEGREDHPVTGISWYGANEYCRWAGLRLPTELEWEKGARGTEGYLFPWGNKWEPSRCHNPESRQGSGTTPVQAFEGGVSPFGLWDMIGNVSEWAWDFYHLRSYERYRKGDIQPSRSGAERVVRGSHYGNIPANNARDYYCSVRTGVKPGTHAALTGFRCAMTPPQTQSSG